MAREELLTLGKFRLEIRMEQPVPPRDNEAFCARAPERQSRYAVARRIDEYVPGKHYLMHVLVATAFDLPRRPDQTTVDHKDNNRSNNRVTNLRWSSPSEQVQHSYATNAGRGTGARRTCKPVRGRKVGTTEWTTYSGGANDAARRLRLAPGNIAACCNAQRCNKTTKGYEFQFTDPTQPDTLEGEEWRDVDFACSEYSRAL